MFGLWAGTIAVGLVAGSALGYVQVAPRIISWLGADAVRAEMIISYRVSNFFWLVFFTTAGIGLLADVPLTMWLFRYGGIVSFEAMYDRWREVTIAIFAAAGLLTPDSLYTMFLIGIPTALAYGLGVPAWVLTQGMGDVGAVWSSALALAWGSVVVYIVGPENVRAWQELRGGTSGGE